MKPLFPGLDANFNPCMTNEEIYIAGGYGWYNKQRKIYEEKLKQLGEKSWINI
jgi:hypothetical protein